MRYIDAGYVVGLTVVAAYAVVLLGRRRRLERTRRAAQPEAGA
ncbi:MAG TPA: hypothetical protein VE991_06485 [Acidimicrobiales bacterium]|nr:hypothetical protein [Acidimicrobiales bacterium]